MSETVDLTIHGTLVDVLTGSLRETTVAVDDGEVVALGDRPAGREIEANYIAPGLIDAHVHVESSMVTPSRYGNAIVPSGVTGVIADPHEIGNVCGVAGVQAMIEDATHTPLKLSFVAPSSVPASHLQDGGATIGVEGIETLLDEADVVALGEVMDIPGLVAGDKTVHTKIEAARERGMTVDGHLPRVTGSDLQEAARYLDTDHESASVEEALEKLRAGLRVYMREGSSSHNLGDLLELLNRPDVDSRRLSLCSDDRDVVDLVEEGSVDYSVKQATDHGVDPVEAVQLATINTAESYGLPTGRVAPGAPADMVLLDDLESWDVAHVLVDGVVDPTAGGDGPPPTPIPTETTTFDPVEASDLAVNHDGPGPVHARIIDASGPMQTWEIERELPVVDGPGEDGIVAPEPDRDVLRLSVIERHGGNGTVGNGFVYGFGIERGAVGMTVAHDAHNCLVAGASHEAMARVANRLREVGGGLVAFDPETGTVQTLELPAGGLMSEKPLSAVTDRFRAVESVAERIGLDHDGGIHAMSFLALEVIPQVRLTNNGLVNVDDYEYVDVVIE
ncbi:MAG: adenine deaminase [Natronomonas sp.]|jgi:adenine deaminase